MLRFRADNNESKQFKSSIITSTGLWENSDNSEEWTISPARWEIEAQYWDSRVRLCLVNDMTGNDWFGSQVIRWMKVNKRVPSFSVEIRHWGPTDVRMWALRSPRQVCPEHKLGQFGKHSDPGSLSGAAPVIEGPSLIRSKDRALYSIK